MKPDITIHGRGFYQIRAESARGRRFMRRVQGSDDHGLAYSDDTRMTCDIADGAVVEGLRVVVNGNHYKGTEAS